MAIDFQSRANILIDPLGRVRAGRNSSSLSGKEDRKRFHQLREWADCILIGGETFRSEPYKDCPRPLIVFSRTEKTISDWRKEFREIAAKYGENILVEAGPGLLEQLIEAEVIDQIHLTRTIRESQDSSSPVFHLNKISDWRLISREEENGDLFEVYRRDQS
jgi:riboflavin biosynthesis pyrimidine reductase